MKASHGCNKRDKRHSRQSLGLLVFIRDLILFLCLSGVVPVIKVVIRESEKKRESSYIIRQKITP